MLAFLQGFVHVNLYQLRITPFSQVMAEMQPKEVAPNVWRVLDPNHGRFYYYNRTTGETSWTPPSGVNDPPSPFGPVTK